MQQHMSRMWGRWLPEACKLRVSGRTSSAMRPAQARQHGGDTVTSGPCSTVSAAQPTHYELHAEIVSLRSNSAGVQQINLT